MYLRQSTHTHAHSLSLSHSLPLFPPLSLFKAFDTPLSRAPHDHTPVTRSPCSPLCRSASYQSLSCDQITYRPPPVGDTALFDARLQSNARLDRRRAVVWRPWGGDAMAGHLPVLTQRHGSKHNSKRQRTGSGSKGRIMRGWRREDRGGGGVMKGVNMY